MQPDFQYDQAEANLNESGTYDLGGSFKRPDMSHLHSFGNENIQFTEQAPPVVENYAQANQSHNSGYLNERRIDHYDDQLRDSQSYDNYNISQSGRIPLVSGSNKKFAQIDHFKNDEDLHVNLNKSIEEKERKKIQDIIHFEKDRKREEEEKENQVIERLAAKISATKEHRAETIGSPENMKSQKPAEPAAMEEPPKPEYPGFEEQIKEIRQGYAKEYSEKIQRGLQELNELKKDMSHKQEIFDSRQVKELRREIKRLEGELLDSQNEKSEMVNQIDTLKLVVKEKDIHIDRVLNSAQNGDGAIETLRETVKEKDLCIEAMCTKMDMFKRNIDDLNFKFLDSQQLLDQMKSQDFAKQNLILKRQTAELTDELALKQKYLEDLKQNMKLAMQSISNTTDHEQQSQIFSNLLENLSQENVKNRRLIDEFQKRENICQRKWNKLLQENLDLQDKINGHSLQLQRTREQYQVIVHQNERKLLEANQRLAWLQNQDDKRSAAEYLVDQMRFVNEEKLALLADNQGLQQTMNEMQYEYQRLERDLKDFLCFRQNDFSDQNMNADPVALNTHRLVSRVEELEDLVIELKSKQSASEVVELKQLVQQLELENIQYTQIVKFLQQKRLSSTELFSPNEMHSSYVSIMKEREKVIEMLHGQLKKMSDQRVMNNQPIYNTHSFGNRSGSIEQYQKTPSQQLMQNIIKKSEPVQNEIENKRQSFEDEKLKDAVNFKNLMQTMNHSDGMATLHKPAYQEVSRPTRDPIDIINSKQVEFNSYSVSAPNSKQDAVFQNFSKNERDQWLLNSSQQSKD